MLDEKDVTHVHETLDTMEQWFPTRIYSIFHQASEVNDVITLLTNRKLHPDDMTTLMVLSERMKIMASALIFIIVDFEKKRMRRNELREYE